MHERVRECVLLFLGRRNRYTLCFFSFQGQQETLDSLYEHAREGSGRCGAWARGGEAPGTLIRICPVSQAWIDRKATGAHSKPPGEPPSGQRMGEDAAQQDRALGQESFSSKHSEKAVGPPRPSKGVVGSISGRGPTSPAAMVSDRDFHHCSRSRRSVKREHAEIWVSVLAPPSNEEPFPRGRGGLDSYVPWQDHLPSAPPAKTQGFKIQGLTIKKRSGFHQESLVMPRTQKISE